MLEAKATFEVDNAFFEAIIVSRGIAILSARDRGTPVKSQNAD